MAHTQSIHIQAADQLADTAVRARSEVRELYMRYQIAYDLMHHYHGGFVPVRKHISGEALLRHNGMLMSMFGLLADARKQVNVVSSYTDTLRDYWITQTDLQVALGGKLSTAKANTATATPNPPQRYRT